MAVAIPHLYYDELQKKLCVIAIPGAFVYSSSWVGVTPLPRVLDRVRSEVRVDAIAQALFRNYSLNKK